MKWIWVIAQQCEFGNWSGFRRFDRNAGAVWANGIRNASQPLLKGVIAWCANGLA